MASTKALLSILFLAAGSVSAATVQPAIKAVPVDGKNGPEDLYRAWNLTGGTKGLTHFQSSKFN